MFAASQPDEAPLTDHWLETETRRRLEDFILLYVIFIYLFIYLGCLFSRGAD